MTGIALVIDLLKRNHNDASESARFFSSAPSASVAVTSAIAFAPFAARGIFGVGKIPVAYCDAGGAIAEAWKEDYFSGWRSASKKLLDNDSFQDGSHGTKSYHVDLKPLFSAFGLRTFAMTSLRSFLLFYLPLLEPHPHIENEDEDDPPDDATEHRTVDLFTPFEKSVKQIARETTVVTVRRVLERFSVHYVSQRMAWKLLKDASQSAKRKAGRGMPSAYFIFCVSRTTFRGHLLGVVASWFVQIGVEVYRYFVNNDNDEEDSVLINKKERFQLFGKKLIGATVKCTASLLFASLGAGLGAYFHPSIGQWIGCAIGDFAGPVVAVIFFEKLHLEI